MSLAFALSTVSGCFISEQRDDEGTILLTVENRTGAELWYFQYASCGSDLWTEVIAADEYVANGSFVSSVDVHSGCYDLYVEDEFGCVSQMSTGEIRGGLEFTWTVYVADLYCYYYY